MKALQPAGRKTMKKIHARKTYQHIISKNTAIIINYQSKTITSSLSG